MSTIARLAVINDERLADRDDWTGGTTFVDIVEIVRDGEVVDVVEVESSTDSEPYDEAVRAAGHLDFEWER